MGIGGKTMADQDCIVPILGRPAPGGVFDGRLPQGDTGMQGQGVVSGGNVDLLWATAWIHALGGRGRGSEAGEHGAPLPVGFANLVEDAAFAEMELLRLVPAAGDFTNVDQR